MAEASLELLVRLFLPEDILEYFEIIHIDHDAKEIRIHLEELNIPPKEYADNKLISKGFLPESSVQDFPVRGKALYLFIKRRRWLNTDTNQLVVRNWGLVSEGTRIGYSGLS